MAKKTHSIRQAITALAGAARAEANGTLTAEEKSEAVNGEMDVLEDSDFMTVAAEADERIDEEVRQEAERLLAEAADDDEQPEG